MAQVLSRMFVCCLHNFAFDVDTLIKLPYQVSFSQLCCLSKPTLLMTGMYTIANYAYGAQAKVNLPEQICNGLLWCKLETVHTIAAAAAAAAAELKNLV